MLFVPRSKSMRFLTLNDGEEVSGCFVGDLHTFRQHWVNGKGAECLGDDCHHCISDPDHYPSFRFRINFVTSVDGKWIAKTFEGGGKVYDKLVALDKKIDLSKTSIEITRRGTKQNTEYDFFPGKEITPELRAKINTADLTNFAPAVRTREPGEEG